ncbi:hypothetical protein ES703_84133 [subsurface metagenome]
MGWVAIPIMQPRVAKPTPRASSGCQYFFAWLYQKVISAPRTQKSNAHQPVCQITIPINAADMAR